MTPLEITLSLLCAALGVIVVIFVRNSDDYLARGHRAQVEASRHALNAAHQRRRADNYARSLEQMNARIGLLSAHNAELEAENAMLHERLLCVAHEAKLTSVARLAVMDRPLMWLPSDRRDREPNTINLN